MFNVQSRFNRKDEITEPACRVIADTQVYIGWKPEMFIF